MTDEKPQTELVPIRLRILLEKNGCIEHVTTGGISIPYTIDLVKRMVRQGGFQGTVSDGDALAFISLCIETGANPYMKEAWLVPTQQGLQPIVSAQYKLSLAHKCIGYRGYTQGWIGGDGIRHKSGTKCTVKQEEIVGVWGIFKRGDEEDLYLETFLSEFKRDTKSGKGNWEKRPLTMLLKVNRDHGIRQKFPELLRGVYTENETDCVAIRPVGSPVSETPKRADRKSVVNEANNAFAEDDTETSITDIGTLMVMADGLRNVLAEGLSIEDEPTKHVRFTHFVRWVFMLPAADEVTDEFFTYDRITKIKETLDNGIPQAYLDELPKEGDER